MNFYVLAGGESSRMGQNKALLRKNGVTVIERVLSAIPAPSSDIKIVTNSADAYRFLSLAIIADIYPGFGPMSGVHAGLVDSEDEFNFFLACDLPRINRELIERIMEKHAGQDIVGVKTGNGREPLCTIYARKCIPVIEGLFSKEKYSMHDLFERTDSYFFEISDSRLLDNVNTPADWRRVSNGFLEKNKKVR